MEISVVAPPRLVQVTLTMTGEEAKKLYAELVSTPHHCLNQPLICKLVSMMPRE